MSIVAMKRKTVHARMGATRIVGPGGMWAQRGPFGSSGGEPLPGPLGFSTVGARRGRTTQSLAMSRSGTRFKGVHAVGNGGSGGRYVVAEPLMNAGAATVDIRGNQATVVKPPTLSTAGMFRTRFRWIHSGQYPNAWVQPLYTGMQTDSASQGVYIHAKSSAADLVSDTNDREKYEGYERAGCRYTKTVGQAVSASEYTHRVQRPCVSPSAAQLPFPHAVSTGVGVLHGGVSTVRGANSCGLAAPVLRAGSIS